MVGAGIPESFSGMGENVKNVQFVLLSQLGSALLIMVIVFGLISDNFLESSFWGAFAVILPNIFWLVYIKTKKFIGDSFRLPQTKNMVSPTIFLAFLFFRPLLSLAIVWASYNSGRVDSAWVNLLTVLVVLKSHWFVFLFRAEKQKPRCS